MNNFFNRNLTAKIISILFALIMWTYVMSEINPKITREFTNVTVQLLNIEDLKQQGLVVVGDINNNIRVTLRGRRDEIYKINKNDIRASVDLKGYRVGSNNVPVELSSLGNIEVDFSPKYLKVELEEIIRRQKEINLIITGSPKTGFVLNEARYKPTVVWIEGPASLVNSVDKVIARLELKEESNDIVASLPLKAVNSKGAEVLNVDIKPPYIDVHMPVDRLKTVRIEPQIKYIAAQGYKVTGVSVFPEQVALRGQQDIINNLNIIETEPINLQNLRETQQIKVGLKLPEGVKTFNDEKVEIRVTVEPIEEKVFSIERENIVFTGLATGVKVDQSTLPELLEVKVRAISSIINKMDVNDLQLLVDLKNFESGTHEVAIKVNVSNISMEEISEITVIPKVINVKLIENND